MRFTELRLSAFGHFSERQVDLSGGDHGLHLIYGPNEAGKSTTLRAIESLLYGFRHNSTDGFLHQNRDLRVGATLIDSDQNTIDCVRRKGRVGTLYDGDDKDPIDESVISKMLRGVDRDAFLDRFGITHDSLVEGGRLIVQGNGDVGQSLFAAGAGIGQLKEIQDAIDAECSELFKKQGTKSKLNELLAGLKEKKQELKACQLRVKDYEDLEAKYESATVSANNYREAMRETRTELKTLEALRDALPLAEEYHRLTNAIESLVATPVLSEDYAERHRRVSVGFATAKQNMELLQARITATKMKLDALGLPSKILDHAGKIQSLAQALGSILKADQQRPGLEKRRDLIQAQINADLQAIGLPESTPPETIGSPQKLRIEISELGSQYQAITDRLASAKEELESLRRQAELAEQAISQFDKPNDPSGIAGVLSIVGDPNALVHDLATSHTARASQRRSIEDQMRRLVGLTCSPEEATALVVPSIETIEEFGKQLEAIKAEQKHFTGKRLEAEESASQLQTHLDELHIAGDVPTEQELNDARARRDEAGQQYRNSRIASSPPESQHDGDGGCEDNGGLEERFFALIAQCDELSDRLRREAERVARRAKLEADHAAELRRIEKLDTRIAEVEVSRETLDQHWLQHWKDSGVQPLSPREMHAWRRDHDRLCEMLVSEHDVRERSETLHRRIEDLTNQLKQALGEINVTPKSQDLVKLVGEARVLHEQVTAQQATYSQLVRDRDEFVRAIPPAEEAMDRCQQALDRWKEQWKVITDRLELEPNSSPRQVSEHVESRQDIVTNQKELASYQHRIDGIDEDAKAFGLQVRSIELPVEDPNSNAIQIIETWVAELSQEQKSQAQREQFDAEICQDQAELKTLEQKYILSQAELDQLCKEALCDDPDRLVEIHRSGEEKKQLDARLREITSRLQGLAAGETIERFLDTIATTKNDDLATQLTELQCHYEEVEESYGQAKKELGELEQERRGMNGSAAAADLQQDIHDLLGQIRHQAEQFVRLRVADTILRTAVTRYREQNQGPILGIASDYFRRLTCGAFSGLRADNNDKGEPELLGIRTNSGESVDVAGMSKGTADQLYLALRLASLKHSFTVGEPIPLIVDDILIQSDDDRCRAAFELLAELSDSTQVIFFTHNRHLIDLAKESVEAHKLFVASFTDSKRKPLQQADVEPKKRRKRTPAKKVEVAVGEDTPEQQLVEETPAKQEASTQTEALEEQGGLLF